jgi:hypothetical protein
LLSEQKDQQTMFGQIPTRFGSLSDNARNQAARGTKLGGRLFAIALLPALVFAVGCAPEARVPVYPVAGKVTFKGQPAYGAQVVLHAANPSEIDQTAPVGDVKSDGTFNVTVYEPGDGAPEGDYVATVQWFKKVGDAMGPNVLPQEYSSPRTSPVKVSVKGGPTNIPPIAIN